MKYLYYELRQSPDFSLSKYASLAETGPSGVLTQHAAFWRQMNQWGKLFQGSIHLIYEFDNDREPGDRMHLVLRFDAPNDAAIESARQIMQASILAPYYDSLRETDASCLSRRKYRFAADLRKREYFIPSSDQNELFYTTSDWKMNDGARLYSMLRLMVVSGVSSAYCVSLYPVDYMPVLENGLANILPLLRQRNALKVTKTPGAVASNGKDDNAAKALEFYEELLDALAASPQFQANIQVLSDSDAAAMQILDAAASEALNEGDYQLTRLELDPSSGSVFEETSHGFSVCSDEQAPDALVAMPYVFTLEQMTPFAVMPVLFPGETIEMSKETVPKSDSGMLIGHDTSNHPIHVPWKNLSKHAFLAGMPGSGKTNTMMYLISRIHANHIPVLVLEPAKREYRSLLSQPGMEDVALFSPCANSMFPIHINPFRFPKGMKLADHINRLMDVFNGTFKLDPPMPMLLTEGIQTVYEDLGWLPGMVNQGLLPYPTMSKLYVQVEKLLDKYQYADEVRSNLQSILQVRIGSLLQREMGDIFDVEDSTFEEEEWLEKSAVIELASLGSGPSNFLMLMLMTLIRESLDRKAFDPDKNGGAPRHMIFLEEAHNLIANKSVQEGGDIDPKISATAYIVKMLAEVRSLGEGIVIADQLPTAMAPEVIKNTSLKFGLRLTSQDERELLASSMSADDFQMERMGIFTPGRCLVSYEGLLKPFELQIPEYKGDSILTDTDLIRLSLVSGIYHGNMLRSAEIMQIKFTQKQQTLLDETQNFYQQMLRFSQMTRELDGNAAWQEASAAGVESFESIDDPTLQQQFRKYTAMFHGLQSGFERLMERWYLLDTEILIYETLSLQRQKYGMMWKDRYSPEQNQALAVNSRQCDEPIMECWRSAKSRWNDLKASGEKYGLKIPASVQNIFDKRRKIISSSVS